MDPGDSKNITQIQREESPFRIFQRDIINASHVLSPVWLRRVVQTNNGLDRLILGSGRSFLWNFRVFLCFIYLVYALLK